TSALGFSPHLPVSVCGTVSGAVMPNEAFLGIWGQRLFSAPKGVLSSPSLPLCGPDLPEPRDMTVQPDIHRRSLLPGCVPPRHCYWFRNFNRISIDYASRPRLRCRLTLSRLTLLRKPSVYCARGSHQRYH